MRKSLLVATSLIAVALALPAGAVQIDSTGPTGVGAGPFGYPATATIGQTFTVGTDTFLDSFSLFVDHRWDSFGPYPSLDLRGYVSAWDGAKASGPVLFESATQTMSVAGDRQEFAFDTALSLLAGQQYVAFLSISALPYTPNPPDDQRSRYGLLFGSEIPDGRFVFNDSAGDFESLWSTTWGNMDAYGPSFADRDIWFKATLNAEQAQVPEPATAGLLGMALLGLGVVRRRRSA